MEFVNKNSYGNLSGIYIIRNKTNGNVYVGQTKQNFSRRYFMHNWQLKQGTHDNKHLQQDHLVAIADNYIASAADQLKA